jgi:hypothetical protein
MSLAPLFPSYKVSVDKQSLPERHHDNQEINEPRSGNLHEPNDSIQNLPQDNNNEIGGHY